MDDMKTRISKIPPFEEEEGEIVEPAASTEEEPKEEPEEEPQEEEKPEEEPEEKEALDNSKNPERTKEYIEKLKEERNKAREEARRVAKEGVVPTVVEQQPKPEFDWNQMLTKTPPPAQEFPGLSQKQVKDVFETLTDDEGYVNTDLLKDELRKAHKQTLAAQEEARQARMEAKDARRTFDDFQRSQLAKEVHKAYPELDPDHEDFNPDYFEAVRDKMIANLAKGQDEDFMGSASTLFERYSMKKAEKEKAKETANAAAQINATGGKGQSSTRKPFGDKEALREAMWKNRKGALSERLKRAGF